MLRNSIFAAQLNKMKANIRKAIREDSATLLNLIQELAHFEKEPDAVIVQVSDIENHGFGSQPLFECFVATVADAVVGMALFYPRYSTWKGPTLHLEDLIVTESMKGKGIGTQLYEAFIQEAYQRGVERIEWNVLDWNTPAIKFYEKSGATLLREWDTVQMDRVAMFNYLNQKST